MVINMILVNFYKKIIYIQNLLYLNYLPRFTAKERNILKTSFNNFANELKITNRDEYNKLYKTFEELTLEEGGLKKLQEKLCMISNKYNENISLPKQETQPKSTFVQTTKKQRNRG